MNPTTPLKAGMVTSQFSLLFNWTMKAVLILSFLLAPFAPPVLAAEDMRFKQDKNTLASENENMDTFPGDPSRSRTNPFKSDTLLSPARISGVELSEMDLRKTTKPSIHLQAKPEILIPGHDIEISWWIEGLDKPVKEQDLRISFSLPEGLVPRDITRNELGDMEIVSSSGEIVFGINEETFNDQKDCTIKAVLKQGDVDLGVNWITLGKVDFSTQPGNQASARVEEQKVRVTVPGDTADTPLAFDVRYPDLDSLPPISLTGRPIEILAVREDTGEAITHFDQSIQIEFQYDEKQIWDWPEEDLKVFYFHEDRGEWFPLETEVDHENNTLIVKTDHLTVFDYKAETWQAASLPSVESFQVSSFTGAGSYGMSFWVPPGPAGLQPKLNLSYNSQVIDQTSVYTQASWVGMGWSLETGSIVRDMHGTDQDASDDTFLMTVAGVSSRLLPVKHDPNRQVTTYMTANQSYLKVEYDQTREVWSVWSRNGIRYTFADQARTHVDQGCVTNPDDLNIIWKWSLTSIRDRHGNTLSFSYHHQIKEGCHNVLAVYPDTILYPHGQYRIRFNRLPRYDYKYAWLEAESEVLFHNQRLKRIDIEHQPNGDGEWQVIRSYEFTHSLDYMSREDPEQSQQAVEEAIYSNFKWGYGGRTLTLLSVQEKHGQDSLPPVKFMYEDDMHLTSIENGMGGGVEIQYERITYLDDINDDIRSVYTDFGTTECVVKNGLYYGTAWETVEGWVGCDPDPEGDNDLWIGYVNHNGEKEVGLGIRSIPEHVLHPGGHYRFFLSVKAQDQAGSTDVNWGIWNKGTSLEDMAHSDEFGEDISSSYVDLESGFEITRDYDPHETVLRLECAACSVSKMQFTMLPLMYRVREKTLRDEVSGDSRNYLYQYDNPASNDWIRSGAVRAGYPDHLYHYPLWEFRGHRLGFTIIAETGLTQANWYYQEDHLKGLPYLTLTLKRDFWEDFSGPIAENQHWRITGDARIGKGKSREGFQVDYDDALIISETTQGLSSAVRRASSLQGERIITAHFRLEEDGDCLSKALIGLEGNPENIFFGIQLENFPEGYSARAVYDSGGGLVSTDVLLQPGELKTNTWYGIMLMIDDRNGQVVRIWQLNDPRIQDEAIVRGIASSEWIFKSEVNGGKLFLDAYMEGIPYSEVSIDYQKENQYLPGQLSAEQYQLNDYYDLSVAWSYPTVRKTRIYDGDSTWVGIKNTYQYDHFGNVIESIEAGKGRGDGDYQDYRMIQTAYHYISDDNYMVSFPKETRLFSCPDQFCDGDEMDLEAIAQNYFDGAENNRIEPVEGEITSQVLSNGADGNIVQEYSYDVYGNRTTIINPRGEETQIQYDPQYHTYPLSVTNPLGQTISTEYDYRIGKPVKITNPNGGVTGAAYDGFGRVTSVCYPGEDCQGTPNLVFFYNDDQTPFTTSAVRKIDADSTMTVQKKYTGFGQIYELIRFGETAGQPSTGQIVTEYEYDGSGKLKKQSVPHLRGSTIPGWTTYTYDALGRILTRTNPNESMTEFQYDGLTTLEIDPMQQVTKTIQDVWGRVEEVHSPEQGGMDPIVYQYNTRDQIVRILQGDLITSIDYDFAGHKIAMADPDMGSWFYTYDESGNLIEQMDARGCVTSMEYDNLNRLVKKFYQGPDQCAQTAPVLYTYDQGEHGVGQRTGMQSGSIHTSWEYNPRGKMISKSISIDGQTFTSSWEYNSTGAVTQMTYPDGEIVNYYYDSLMNLTGMENEAGFTYLDQASYDPQGRKERHSLGNDPAGNPILIQVFDYYGWEENGLGGQLRSIKGYQYEGDILQEQYYDYDLNGNIVQRRDPIHGKTFQYQYDSLNRLIAIDINSQFDREYSFDQLGRMIYTAGAHENPEWFQYDTRHPHAVVERGDHIDYQYDANGNQIQKDHFLDQYSYSYDAENRLVEVDVRYGSSAASADFDGDGDTDLSVYRPANGKWYIREQGPILWGTPGDLPVPADYDADGIVDIAVYRPGNGNWYIKGIGIVSSGWVDGVPLPCDYDGDGTEDPAVYDPETGKWYVHSSGEYNYGKPGDIPVPEDYNGDGICDLAVYRPSNGVWYIKDQGFLKYGYPDDIPVPDDYNGDGTTDLAVYRPSNGNWYIRGAGYFSWGFSGDVPIPGDYDGDGSADLAVLRPSNGKWYIKNLGNFQWYRADDFPLPMFDRDGDGEINFEIYTGDDVMTPTPSATIGNQPGLTPTSVSSMTPTPRLSETDSPSPTDGETASPTPTPTPSPYDHSPTATFAPEETTPTIESSKTKPVRQDTAAPTPSGKPGEEMSPTNSPTSSKTMTAAPTEKQEIIITETPAPEATRELTATFLPSPASTQTILPETTVVPSQSPVPTLVPTSTKPGSTALVSPQSHAESNPEIQARMEYDGDGNLVKSNINGVITYTIGENYQVEYKEEEIVERKMYYADGQKFALRVTSWIDQAGSGEYEVQEGSELYWILKDHLGSSSIITHADGRLMADIEYDAFGKMANVAGELPTDVLYSGQRLFSDLGLYFYRSRWYDPDLMHFTQPDPFVPDPANPQDLNRYGYVRFNPLRFTDPTGNRVESDQFGSTRLDNWSYSPQSGVSVTVNLASSIPAYYWSPGTGKPAAQYNYDHEMEDIPEDHYYLCGQVSVSMIYETITGKENSLGYIYNQQAVAPGSGTSSHELAEIAALSLPTGWKTIGYAWGWVHEFTSGYQENTIGESSSTKLDENWFADGEDHVRNMLFGAIQKGYYLIAGVYQETGGKAGLSPDGVGHWVVVNSFYELDGKMMVKINNPFTNRVEVYTWNEFWDCFAYWAVIIQPPDCGPGGSSPPGEMY